MRSPTAMNLHNWSMHILFPVADQLEHQQQFYSWFYLPNKFLLFHRLTQLVSILFSILEEFMALPKKNECVSTINDILGFHVGIIQTRTICLHFCRILLFRISFHLKFIWFFIWSNLSSDEMLDSSPILWCSCCEKPFI